MTDTDTTDTTDTTDRKQPESQHFVERLAENYQPAPLGANERTRFDATLRDRVARRRLAATWAPSLAAAAAASLVLAWWIWPTSTLLPQPSPAVAAIDTSWETDVLSVDADSKVAEEDYLPDEYMAIAFVFIDEA